MSNSGSKTVLHCAPRKGRLSLDPFARLHLFRVGDETIFSLLSIDARARSAPTNPATGLTTIVRRKAPTKPGDHFCCWPFSNSSAGAPDRPVLGVKQTCS